MLLKFNQLLMTNLQLNATIETLVGLDGSDEMQGNLTKRLSISLSSTGVVRACLRVFTTLLSVVVSIAVPEFESVMAFLGSFSAFFICVIGPICAKMAIDGRARPFDWIILVIAIVMAAWGTAVAFM